MSDYKETLNLPDTGFAMKANLPSKEPKMIEFWEEMDLRKEVAAAREGREKFIVDEITAKLMKQLKEIISVK